MRSTSSADFRGPLLAPAVPRPRDGFKVIRPQIEDYRELLAAMGVALPADWIPRLALPEVLRARGHERLERAGIGDRNGQGGGTPRVGLSPGAEWGNSKRWPMRYWSDLARELRRRIPGVREAIFVGPKEIWLGVRVHEESGKIHPLLGPDLDLAGLAAAMAGLDLLVTKTGAQAELTVSTSCTPARATQTRSRVGRMFSIKLRPLIERQIDRAVASASVSSSSAYT